MAIISVATSLLLFCALVITTATDSHQPLSKVLISSAEIELDVSIQISTSATVLGANHEHVENVTVTVENPQPSNSDWIGLFSPAITNTSTCNVPDAMFSNRYPKLCSAPIKYKFVNISNPSYTSTGHADLTFRLINQRQDFSFGLFTGGIITPKLIAMSDPFSFKFPKDGLYPRLALGKSSNEVTVTWTSGFDQDVTSYVVWGPSPICRKRSYAKTLTFDENDVCGAPANTVGWRDPGFIHTSSMRTLKPNARYYYAIVHEFEGAVLYKSDIRMFKSPPSPGQDVKQQLIFFGDMGKAESDGSSEYGPDSGALNTTMQLENDLANIDLVMDMGDISYADGYLAQWDQYTEQITKVASVVPWMTVTGNHERDWYDSSSFYNTSDSGGECGVPGQVMFNMPAENRATPWYKVDYGLFRICVADTESDWTKGSRQYAFLENCFATVNRHMQPWLLMTGHRVLGYSTSLIYGRYSNFSWGEPQGRDNLQELWQRYKVDIAIYGHSHNYERTCPVFDGNCQSSETSDYSGKFNATINIIAGGGGGVLFGFDRQQSWSVHRDVDFGFVKMTSFNHSYLLVEYRKSSTGEVSDSFTIRRRYQDVLGCDAGKHFCPPVHS